MSSFENLDWQQLLQKISEFSTSELARSQIKELEPLESKELAQQSSQKIFDSVSIIESNQRPFMESLDLYQSWSQRLQKKSVLSTLELKDIRFFCVEIFSLKNVLLNSSVKWIQTTAEQLLKAEELLSAIEQIITHDGNIKSDASEKLYSLYQEKNTLTSQVQKVLDKLIKDDDMTNILQEKFVTTREGRLVIPIRSGRQHSFKGILHASSQSKQTVFMEPNEVVQLNNHLREIESDIEKEIQFLLKELSNYLHSHFEDLKIARTIMLQFDVLLAKSQFSNRVESQPFQFSDHTIELNELRNPLLVFNENTVVPNSVELNTKNRILILSGPNAGGKTVLLKSIGLSAQMARCGLPICAKRNSKIPFFKKVLVSVGDAQNIDENLSTFAAHLKILNEAAHYKSSDNLLLIDEICSSTDPEEGAALARSFINTYAKNHVFAIITSHFGHLKNTWQKDLGVVNGSLEFDQKNGPTYQFIIGVPGQSLALQTAKRVGVSQSIINEALDFLSPEQKQYNQDLNQIEDLKKQLKKAKDEYLERQESANENKKKYEKLLREFEKEKETILTQSVKHAEKEIESLIELARAKKIFDNHSHLQKLKSDLPQIIKPTNSKNKSTSIDGPKDFSRRFPPGSKVYVSDIGRDAIVQSEVNERGDIEILSNSMRLFINWKKLKPAHSLSNFTHEVFRKNNISLSHTPTEKKEIDLRGLSTEDALSEITTYLNTALLINQDKLKIIHGHGTEALKKSVRQYLSSSIYIRKWEAGGTHNGGDGVTWAEIADELKKSKKPF